MLPAIQARPPGTFVGHFLQEFVALGVPEQVKTDNGPAYISQKLHSSFQQQGPFTLQPFLIHQQVRPL